MFENFRIASGLATKEAKIQVYSLIYSMAMKLMISYIHLAAQEKNLQYEVAKASFQSFFIKKRNVI